MLTIGRLGGAQNSYVAVGVGWIRRNRLTVWACLYLSAERIGFHRGRPDSNNAMHSIGMGPFYIPTIFTVAADKKVVPRPVLNVAMWYGLGYCLGSLIMGS